MTFDLHRAYANGVAIAAEAGIVGRERELAAVADFIEAFPGAPHALVIEGEAGIGKTTLWRRALAAVSPTTYRVLVARPGESEARLSFAGISDLLGDVAEDVLPLLPGPQRRALDVALLRADLAEGPIDARTISAAVATSLGLLSRAAPVLIAIDDVQWLDRASARVSEFAARRLGDQPVGLLLSVRTAKPLELPLGLDRALPPDMVRRVRLGPLNFAELHYVIRDAIGQVFPRPTLARIEAASHGNPLTALELARAVVASGSSLAPGQPLPVSEQLGELLMSRIDRLPVAVRRLLLYAAASPAPSVDLLIAAMGGDQEGGTRALARAEAGAIVEADGAVIRFTHPLLRSAIYGSASEADRRAAHRVLSDVAPGLEERARHRALSADGPDEDAAGILERAARMAGARGAPEGAAELMELAWRLTPPSHEARLEARTLALGRHAFQAGDTGRGREVLDALLERSTDAAVRAQAHLLLGTIAWLTGPSVVAHRHVEAALAEAGPDRTLQAEAHVALAELTSHDKRLGLRHARTALSILEKEEQPDPRLAARALYAVMLTEADVGGALRTDLAARAAELEMHDLPARVADRISHNLGVLLVQRDDFERARELLEESRRLAVEAGDEGSLPRILQGLAFVEFWAGNWTLAASYADDQFDQAERTDQQLLATFARIHRALVDAHRGLADEASAAAGRTLEIGLRTGEIVTILESHRVLGCLELARRNPLGADAHFTALDQIAERSGTLDPGSLRHHGDHIEALVALGEHDRARALLERLEGRARAIDHRWGLATAARSRAILLAATGDLDGALAAIDEAHAAHERLAMPYELGRTLLVEGMLQRRRRKKDLARRALERAAQIFQELGAALWLERTRAEIGRLGERPGGSLELSPTERRVAELSAAGLTNRDVAERLFISPKTVEFNLAKVYRKLGISSRAELGVRMTEAGPK